MAVETGAIQTGTITIKIAIQVDIQELETILQPFPMGMSTLGLELKFKFTQRFLFYQYFCEAIFNSISLSPLSYY